MHMITYRTSLNLKLDFIYQCTAVMGNLNIMFRSGLTERQAIFRIILINTMPPVLYSYLDLVCSAWPTIYAHLLCSILIFTAKKMEFFFLIFLFFEKKNNIFYTTFSFQMRLLAMSCNNYQYKVSILTPS